MNRLTVRKRWLLPAVAVAAMFVADAARGAVRETGAGAGRARPTETLCPQSTAPRSARPQPLRPRPPQPYGQPFQQPNQPPQQPSYRPPQQQTVWITVWSCSKCGREVGRGDRMPDLTKCPHCGAHLQAAAPVSQRQAVPAEKDQFPADLLLPLALIAAGVCVAVFLVVIIVVRRRPTPAFDAADPGSPPAGDWRVKEFRNE